MELTWEMWAAKPTNLQVVGWHPLWQSRTTPSPSGPMANGKEVPLPSLQRTQPCAGTRALHLASGAQTGFQHPLTPTPPHSQLCCTQPARWPYVQGEGQSRAQHGPQVMRKSHAGCLQLQISFPDLHLQRYALSASWEVKLNFNPDLKQSVCIWYFKYLRDLREFGMLEHLTHSSRDSALKSITQQMT